MPAVLAPLRRNLDVMPSPVADRPGLLLRDPYAYADTVVIVPPPLVACLACFDGERTELDLRESLVRITGDLEVGELLRHFVDALGTAGFLENESFAAMKERRHRSFAAAATRTAVHSGSAYPAEPARLHETLGRYLQRDAASVACGSRALIGIAAPHVSPEGGWGSYGAAYRLLGEEHRDRVFVVLGTSHYGEPGRFGLTRKAFETPLGRTNVPLALVDRLIAEGGAAVALEDYCHAIEHSIEFQVIFLQHLFGPAVSVLPVLCGPLGGGDDASLPESDADVGRFMGALAALAAREGEALLWILGVDMAHVGRRYGDPFRARSRRGPLQEVERRDEARIGRIAAGDADGFWESIGGHDELKWCGTAPLYTFLRAAAPLRGELLHYEQWNIDADSVVSFAGMGFSRA